MKVPTHVSASFARDPDRRLRGLFVVICATLLFTIASLLGYKRFVRRTHQLKDHVVEVRSGSSHGSGFFLRSPRGDSSVYIVTARHVIDNGEPISVTHWFHNGPLRYPVEYPRVEVVATDATRDLALLRLKDVPTSVLPALTLREQPPVPESRAKVCGFPRSAQVSEGVLDTTCLDVQVHAVNGSSPLIDPLTHRELQGDPVPLVIFSNVIASGFSGGPIVDENNQVLGVVFRDDRSNNAAGAVHLDALRHLVRSVDAFPKANCFPNADAVQRRLNQIVSEYLSHPNQIDDPVHEYVSLADTKPLHELAAEIVAETDARTEDALVATRPLDAFIAIYETRTSRTQADSWLDFSTLRNPNQSVNVRQNMHQCVRRRLFVGDARRACAGALERALGYDLLRSTLQWDGTATPLALRGEPRRSHGDIYLVELTNNVTVPLRFAEGKVWVALFETVDGEVRPTLARNNAPHQAADFRKSFRTTAHGVTGRASVVTHTVTLRELQLGGQRIDGVLQGVIDVHVLLNPDPSRGCYDTPVTHMRLDVLGEVKNQRALLYVGGSSGWTDEGMSPACRRALRDRGGLEAYVPGRMVLRFTPDNQMQATVIPGSGASNALVYTVGVEEIR